MGREQLDITRADSVRAGIPPGTGVVINCAAYTDVDGAEREPDKAQALNALGVAVLAERCREVGAVLVEPAQPGEEGVIDFTNDVDGSGGCHLYMPGGGSLNPTSQETVAKKMHYVHQEGQQVFKYAVRRMADVAAGLLDRNGFTPEQLSLVIPHQANLRIIQAMQQRLGVPDSKVLVNIDRYGNTTAGTIPLGMMTALEEGRLKKGDLVMLVSVGAGFTTGGMLLRWAY